MKIRFLLTLCLTLVFSSVKGQSQFETADVDRFWRMYDRLSSCTTLADSIRLVQENYLDSATVGFKKFIRLRNMTADSYVANFRKYPGFWKSLRSKHTTLAERRSSANRIFTNFESAFRKFERPNVCLAVGVLTTGGTVKGDWLLLGAELVLADSTTDTSELSAWLQGVIGKEDQFNSFIAHETVHAQQKMGLPVIWGYFFRRKATMSILEGSADFICREILGTTINPALYAYGFEHEEELKGNSRKTSEATISANGCTTERALVPNLPIWATLSAIRYVARIWIRLRIAKKLRNGCFSAKIRGRYSCVVVISTEFYKAA